MPSVRSRALNFLTRIATRIAYRKPREVTEYRPRYAQRDARARVSLPPGLVIEEQVDPIAGRWIRNAASPRKVILYLHGGAFVLRLPNTHTAFAAGFCADLAASAFLPWYRLAPEHPFPAAPEDCLAAYRHLLAGGYRASDIVLMGDSAGGNLVLSLLHLIGRAELPRPRAAAVFSPITDFAQISATWRLNQWRDPMYVVQGAVSPQRHYLQGANPLDPVASPYYGELRGFPPVLIVVGSVEALLDDATSFVKKAVEAGVSARVQIWKGMPHAFLLYDFLPETALARRAVVGWLQEVAADKASHRSCVEVLDRTALTGRLRRETNDASLAEVFPRTQT